MRTEILTASQRAVLDALTPLAWPGAFYLAGGTALALRHGHRRSIDFDFFRPDPFDAAAVLAELESVFDIVERMPSGPRTVYVRLRGVTTSFFEYKYPLLEPAEATSWGFGLAADLDIAAMKVEAVAGRGSRKDFVDLRMLCATGLGLDEILDAFDRKYGTGRVERYHRLRALAYFEDAERQPMPEMLTAFEWDEAKRFFALESARLLREGIG